MLIIVSHSRAEKITKEQIHTVVHRVLVNPKKANEFLEKCIRLKSDSVTLYLSEITQTKVTFDGGVLIESKDVKKMVGLLSDMGGVIKGMIHVKEISNESKKFIFEKTLDLNIINLEVVMGGKLLSYEKGQW